MWIKLEQYVSLTASWLKSQADKWKQTQLYVNEKGLRRQPLLPEAPQPAGLPSWGLPLLPPPPPALTLEALKRGLLSAPHPASALAEVASCPSANPLCAAHSCPQSSPMLCSLRRCVCVFGHFSRVRLCVTHGLQPARLLCPWDSPGKNTGVGYRAFLQGIFPAQGSNPHLPNCRRVLYLLSHL